MCIKIHVLISVFTP